MVEIRVRHAGGDGSRVCVEVLTPNGPRKPPTVAEVHTLEGGAEKAVEVLAGAELRVRVVPMGEAPAQVDADA